MTKSFSRAAWLLVGVAAAISGILASAMLVTPKAPVMKSATLLKTPRPIAEFSLLDQDGQAAGTDSIKGQWTVLFAGFTHCPNICPATLSLLGATLKQVDPAPRPQVVLLSVDPERDTPQRLKSYLAQFDPHFKGLTGDEQKIATVRSSLGLIAEKTPGASPDSYTVDHSAALVLINPRGEVAGYITPPFDPAVVAHDLRKLMQSKA